MLRNLLVINGIRKIWKVEENTMAKTYYRALEMDLGQEGERVPRPFCRDGRQLYRLHGPKMVVDIQVRTEEPGKRELPVLLQAAVKKKKN